MKIPTINIARRLQTNKRLYSWRILLLATVFSISTVSQLFVSVIAPTSAHAVTEAAGLAVGTYNILGYYHGDGTRYATDRLQQIVKNINTLKYDVVGLQEYRDQASGDPKALEKELQKLNSAWRMAYNEHGVQLNYVYNSSTVRLVTDKAVRTFENPDCTGGTPYVRIATFQTVSNGDEFLVINVHPNSQHGGSGSTCNESTANRERLRVVQGALNDPDVEKYAGPILFVGDFNARPDTPSSGSYDPGAERYLATKGYANARDIPAAVKRTGGSIDHIYYKTSSISAPSSYETMDCKPIPGGDPRNFNSSTTCASDHTPVKAVFDDLSGSGGSSCASDGLEQGVALQYQEWGIGHYGNECVCSEGASSMTGDTNFAKIATYFSSKGLKDIAIAGILANLQNESHLSPFSVQRQPHNTTEDREPPSGGGYGIAQFTPATKIEKELKKNSQTSEHFDKYYSTKYGGYEVKPWNEGGTGIPDGVPVEVNEPWLKVQLDFFYKGEMQSTKVGQYRNMGGTMGLDYIQDSDTILEALTAAKNEKDAARIFVWIYERPGDKPGAAADREKVATDMLAPLQDIVGSGVPATSAGSDCNTSTATGDVQALINLAKEYAWVKGKDPEAGGPKQKPAYANAVKEAQAKDWHVGGDQKVGNDCQGFVNILMRNSGYETNWPNQPTDGLADAIAKLPGWSKVGTQTDREFSTADLQPGDVLVTPSKGHVLVFIGKVDWTSSQFVEAANGSNRAPYTMGTPPSYWSSGYVVFRKGGTSGQPTL